LDFAFVPELLAATSLLEPAEVCRTELKPFLTILGTTMRAILFLQLFLPFAKLIPKYEYPHKDDKRKENQDIGQTVRNILKHRPFPSLSFKLIARVKDCHHPDQENDYSM